MYGDIDVLINVLFPDFEPSKYLKMFSK
jgi:hypothetical protein